MIIIKPIDVEDAHADIVQNALKKHLPEGVRVYAFGSRANWQAKRASDLDLAIDGDNTLKRNIADLEEELSQSDLPYKVDIVDLNSIADSFRGAIEADLVAVLWDWEEMRLGEIVELSKDNWKVGDEPLPYIALEHIEEGRLRLNGIGTSDEVASNKYRFNEETFLYGKLRPYFRKLIKPTFKGVCSTDIWVVKPKGKNDLSYLFYLFANQEFVDLSYTGSSGTRMPRADWNFMAGSYWKIPASQHEQKAIAGVLSSLDDKIDLLHRQNKTLESTAETLFRQYFIEEAQDDWGEVPLSYFGDIICGKTPSKKKTEYFHGDLPFIKIPDMHGNTYITYTVDTLTEEGKNSQNNKTIPPFSICVSCIATVGLVSMNVIESQTNQQINTIIPYKEIYRYYLFLYMKNSFDLLQAMGSGGTATLNINTTNFSKMKIEKPDDNILEGFLNEVKPMFDKILSNQTQIQTLENLRDTLLSKLMSGAVRVEFEEAA